MQRPTLKSSIIPFPSTESFEFDFFYSGQAQAVRNNLIIEKVSDNTEVYNQVQETFSLKHVLPENTLTNGVQYKAKIRVGDINNNWSDFSDWVVFYVLSPPILEITTIDYENQNRVYNQTVNFETSYTQLEGELLQSYRYLLYDSNKNLMYSFPEIFTDGSQPLIQEITNLENGILYYIEVKTISVNGALGSTGLINFKPFYVTPKLSAVLTPENLPEQGAIKVSSVIIQLIGKLYDKNNIEINPLDIEYIDNEWLDLTRDDYGKLVFQDGFNLMQSDFILKIWCKNIIDNKVFFTMVSNHGKIELIKYNNIIHAFKHLNQQSITPHYASNELEILEDQEFVICMKHINNAIDLEIALFEGGD